MTAPQPSWDDVVAAALPDYRRWLGAVARDLCGWANRGYHDDLVQEGYVAMWRAAATYDPARGALASWLTTAARYRMTDVARRGFRTWTGHVDRTGARPSVEHVTQPASLDDADADAFDVEDVTASNALDAATWAYHAGDLRCALEQLTPRQRRYVVLKFWHGWSPAELDAELGPRSRALWRDARHFLERELRHLVEV